jgi:hypothetical protein
MTPLALRPTHLPVVREVRCECTVCGTHATGWQAHTLGASCDNCGSYDMRPVPLSEGRAAERRSAAS